MKCESGLQGQDLHTLLDLQFPVRFSLFILRGVLHILSDW